MKLAEALITRADAQRKMSELTTRLQSNAKVQEGDQPSEDPQALLNQVEGIASSLTTLIQSINKTNLYTMLPDGSTVTDAIARRDMLQRRAVIYRDLALCATVKQDRYTRSEVRFVSTVNVTELQKRADELSRECRALDGLIQQTNWTTDLL